MTTDAERALRVDLAAAYRLVQLFGWDDLIFTHISAKLPARQGSTIPGEERFLINPYGMLFEEITASSLVVVDAAGQKLSESPYPVNPAGFVIHSAIHAARHDAVCVLHTHANAGVALSARKEGLLPISQIATIVLPLLGYHDYEGIAVRDDEKPRLVRDLEGKSALILRNHGLLTVGASVGEAFVMMYALTRACEIQLLAQRDGKDLVHVDERILEGVAANIGIVTKGMGPGIAWPALLRRLDRMNPGYRD
jgi:ribulose-5-phosphate 4-epimerase/fuculose-1-phosphate aldolase